ncbi:unnamed protein product, partial [Closterium sp. Yama58-4]
GGAIELSMLSGMANITDCTFRNNRVTNGPSFGAGILSFGSPMRVERSYFWRNEAVNMLPPGSQASTYLTQGGAIDANMFMDTTVVYDVIDSTFVENKASTYLTQGGAIDANMFMDTTVVYDVIDSTFVENKIGDFARRSAQIGDFSRRSAQIGDFSRRSAQIGDFSRRSAQIGEFVGVTLQIVNFAENLVEIGSFAVALVSDECVGTNNSNQFATAHHSLPH